MKRFKLFCSAIAALTVLALAGCDMEVPDSEKVEILEDNADPVEMSVTKLPYLVEGRVGPDSSLAALKGAKKADGTEWTAKDGLSISFYMTNYKSDWSMIFQVPSSNFGTTTAHYCDNKTWKANAYGCQSGNGTWDEFITSKCFVTISMDYVNHTMTFYKDGEKVTVYGTGEKGGFDVYDAAFDTDAWVTNILKDIESNGIYCIHPSDSWANASQGRYTLSYFYVDESLDDNGAKDVYDNWVKK